MRARVFLGVPLRLRSDATPGRLGCLFVALSLLRSGNFWAFLDTPTRARVSQNVAPGAPTFADFWGVATRAREAGRVTKRLQIAPGCIVCPSPDKQARNRPGAPLLNSGGTAASVPGPAYRSRPGAPTFDGFLAVPCARVLSLGVDRTECPRLGRSGCARCVGPCAAPNAAQRGRCVRRCPAWAALPGR